MASQGGSQKNGHILTFGYYMRFITSVILVVPPAEARSAVLEQMDNGLISEWNGGVSEGTPPRDYRSSEAVLPANLDVLPRAKLTNNTSGSPPFATSIVLDVDPHPATRAGHQKPGYSRFGAVGKEMPPPRALAAAFSREQYEMRTLATQIGLRFSQTEGVAKAGLDQKSFVTLFTTMIHRESNFDERAESPAGARGLGQLMPATARAMGVCDVFSGRENLEGAARYLTLMLNQFSSPSLALAAYNAGPGAVQKYQGIPPYPETRQYVADIIHATKQRMPDQIPSNSVPSPNIGDRYFEPLPPDGATPCNRMARQ